MSAYKVFEMFLAVSFGIVVFSFCLLVPINLGIGIYQENFQCEQSE